MSVLGVASTVVLSQRSSALDCLIINQGVVEKKYSAWCVVSLKEKIFRLFFFFASSLCCRKMANRRHVNQLFVRKKAQTT